MKPQAIALTVVIGGAMIAAGVGVSAQRGPGRGAPPTPRAAAPVDLTGYWVSVVTEDWRFRMVTPPKGDYASLPLNAEARRVADSWDPSKDGLCDAYGAAAIMRMPGRLHITWQDDTTLKIETDAGQQTRLLHFGASGPAAAGRTLQGYSAAEWGRGGGAPGLGGFGGFGGNVAPPDAAPARGTGTDAAPPAPGRGAPPAAVAGRGAPPAAAPPAVPGRGPGPERWAPLKVVTTGMRGAWLRKNGVPYSENAVMTEHFIRFSDGSDQWFTVVTIVEDPTYLTQSFITSTNFKREADGARFKPVACRAS
ncbi:MAG: hypothetical protein ABI868_15425 [Acidobacteriota bacterium]